MDIDLTTKLAASLIAGLGMVLGLFQFLTTRRSHGYQNYKTELELLGHSMAGEEADPDFKRFLLNVRKEKISFLAFGIPLPNAELERVIKYYQRGIATTHDIAKAWPYRNPTKKELSFELHGPFKSELFFFHLYGFLCLVALVMVTVGTGKSLEKAPVSSFKELIPFGIALAIIWLYMTFLVRKNEGLLTAARLAKLEKASATDSKR